MWRNTNEREIAKTWEETSEVCKHSETRRGPTELANVMMGLQWVTVDYNVFVYIYIYMHIYIHVYSHAHRCICAYTYIYIYIYTYIHHHIMQQCFFVFHVQTWPFPLTRLSEIWITAAIPVTSKFWWFSIAMADDWGLIGRTPTAFALWHMGGTENGVAQMSWLY